MRGVLALAPRSRGACRQCKACAGPVAIAPACATTDTVCLSPAIASAFAVGGQSLRASLQYAPEAARCLGPKVRPVLRHRPGPSAASKAGRRFPSIAGIALRAQPSLHPSADSCAALRRRVVRLWPVAAPVPPVPRRWACKEARPRRSVDKALTRAKRAYMFRRYCPPTSNNELVICPSEQTRTASISTSNTFLLSITAC